jgi:FolB domain-containing protein
MTSQGGKSGDRAAAGDRILIKDLLLRGIVGIKPDERVNAQDILINLALVADLRPAGASDRIEDCVNYRTITKEIIALVEASDFRTVEKLAEEIARQVLAHPEIAEVEVTVEKPGALRFARSVGVTIVRRREA